MIAGHEEKLAAEFLFRPLADQPLAFGVQVALATGRLAEPLSQDSLGLGERDLRNIVELRQRDVSLAEDSPAVLANGGEDGRDQARTDI